HVGTEGERTDRRDREEPDAEGRTTFGYLEPGSDEVVLYLEAGKYEWVPIARSPITLRAGINQASVPLPKLHGLTVLIDYDGPETMLGIMPAGETDNWLAEPVGKGGRVTFEGLPAGAYTLTSWGGP